MITSEQRKQMVRELMGLYEEINKPKQDTIERLASLSDEELEVEYQFFTGKQLNFDNQAPTSMPNNEIGKPPQIKKFRGIATTILILVALIGGFLLTLETVGFVPDNAIVFIDSETATYYSPHTMTQELADELGVYQSTLGDAEKFGFDMSEEDRANGYFTVEGRVIGNILRDIGLLPSNDRIDSEGNWLY